MRMSVVYKCVNPDAAKRQDSCTKVPASGAKPGSATFPNLNTCVDACTQRRSVEQAQQPSSDTRLVRFGDGGDVFSLRAGKDGFILITFRGAEYGMGIDELVTAIALDALQDEPATFGARPSGGELVPFEQAANEWAVSKTKTQAAKLIADVRETYVGGRVWKARTVVMSLVVLAGGMMGMATLTHSVEAVRAGLDYVRPYEQKIDDFCKLENQLKDGAIQGTWNAWNKELGTRLGPVWEQPTKNLGTSQVASAICTAFDISPEAKLAMYDNNFFSLSFPGFVQEAPLRSNFCGYWAHTKSTMAAALMKVVESFWASVFEFFRSMPSDPVNAITFVGGLPLTYALQKFLKNLDERGTSYLKASYEDHFDDMVRPKRTVGLREHAILSNIMDVQELLPIVEKLTSKSK